MRWIFHIAWFALLAGIAGTAPLLPADVGDPGKTMPRLGFMLLMFANAAFTPWLVTHGTSRIARRHPQYLSLPNKDYWFSEPRRDASLAWLERHNLGLGLAVVCLMAASYYPALQRPKPGWPPLPGPLPLVVPFLLYAGYWAWASYRRFPKPPADALPPPPRRPRRPPTARR